MDAHHQRIPSYELFLLISFSPERIIASQNEESKPAVLTAVMERGAVVYKLNGKRVEDRKDNLLFEKPRLGCNADSYSQELMSVFG